MLCFDSIVLTAVDLVALAGSLEPSEVALIEALDHKKQEVPDHSVPVRADCYTEDYWAAYPSPLLLWFILSKRNDNLIGILFRLFF